MEIIIGILVVLVVVYFMTRKPAKVEVKETATPAPYKVETPTAVQATQAVVESIAPAKKAPAKKTAAKKTATKATAAKKPRAKKTKSE